VCFIRQTDTGVRNYQDTKLKALSDLKPADEIANLPMMDLESGPGGSRWLFGSLVSVQYSASIGGATRLAQALPELAGSGFGVVRRPMQPGQYPRFRCYL
jgi:hypothetical protein